MNRSIILLLFLSIAAGSVDTIGFLGLGGLFAAHITGNIVVLAAHFVTGKFSTIGPLLAVPVFMLMLALATIIGGKIEKTQFSPLISLLIIEVFLLLGSLVLGERFGPFVDLNSSLTVMTGMLAVSAMAIQSATLKLAINNAPSTVAMTNNITQMTLSFAQLTFWHQASAHDKAQAKHQIKIVFITIFGFTMGCGIGAMLQLMFGFNAFLLPIGLIIFSIFLNPIKAKGL